LGGRSGVDGWTMAVCLSRIFLFANFMTVAAVIPLLQEAWAISAAQAGAIVTAFTVSYAASLFGFGWVADYVGAKRAVIASALASGFASLAFGLFARDWWSAFLLYGLAGLSQGGIYTPLIMLFADRTAPARRGTAMGWLIASTSVGYAFSLAMAGLALGLDGYRAAFLLTGALPLVGTVLLIACLWKTENVVHGRPPQVSLAAVLFRNREARLLTAGYTAHNWELLGSWAWMPALLAAAFVLSGSELGAASEMSAWLTGGMHILGAGSAFVMGTLSDRLGRRTVLIAVAAIAAGLSLGIGWLVVLPAALLVALALVQTFMTIGDSPVLTTALTEVVEPGILGAALAVRFLLGFGAGAISPLAAGAVLDWAEAAGAGHAVSWGLTFALLGLGGVTAAGCAAALRR
jgi:MFS family permease